MQDSNLFVTTLITQKERETRMLITLNSRSSGGLVRSEFLPHAYTHNALIATLLIQRKKPRHGVMSIQLLKSSHAQHERHCGVMVCRVKLLWWVVGGGLHKDNETDMI